MRNLTALVANQPIKQPHHRSDLPLLTPVHAIAVFRESIVKPGEDGIWSKLAAQCSCLVGSELTHNCATTGCSTAFAIGTHWLVTAKHSITCLPGTKYEGMRVTRVGTCNPVVPDDGEPTIVYDLGVEAVCGSLDIAIVRCTTASFSRLAIKDTACLESREPIFLVEATGVRQQHLHRGEIYFGVDQHHPLEANHSCWSEKGSSGSPLLDMYGYVVGIHVGAYEPHRYMVRTEGLRLFLEGLNTPGYGRQEIGFECYTPPTQRPWTFYERFKLSKWVFKGNSHELELVTGVETVATGAGSEVEEVSGAKATGGEVGGGIGTVAVDSVESEDGVSSAGVAGEGVVGGVRAVGETCGVADGGVNRGGVGAGEGSGHGAEAGSGGDKEDGLVRRRREVFQLEFGPTAVRRKREVDILDLGKDVWRRGKSRKISKVE